MTMGYTNRRTALGRLALLLGGAVVSPAMGPLLGPLAARQEEPETAADEKIFRKIMKRATVEGLAGKPIGEVMAAIGHSFVGVPYIAHSLEVSGDERLVVNLRAFDCTTFYESTLILSRCIKLHKENFADYRQQLQFVRYRAGNLDGYSSRLHYFTDWVADNGRKNVVRDVTRALGGVILKKRIDFMSTHRSAYPHLSDDHTLDKIKEMEQQLNARELYYLPKHLVAEKQGGLRPGDIIGIVTSIEGLDVSHTGMAVIDGGTLKFLHAPLSGGSVEVSPRSLAEYLKGHDQQTGIVVARPLEPTA